MTEPPPDRVSQVGGIVRIVQSLTFTHVLIIALLVAIAVPTYIGWRFLNDASLLNKFTSFYEELASDKVACTLRIASQRGANPYYSISTGFAFQGSDRYTVGVILVSKPDDAELVSYCETLTLLVDHLRRPEAPEPTFPSGEPMIWHYPQGAPP
jgi:hypothetical protein